MKSILIGVWIFLLILYIIPVVLRIYVRSIMNAFYLEKANFIHSITEEERKEENGIKE
jgi:hypothetical protein